MKKTKTNKNRMCGQNLTYLSPLCQSSIELKLIKCGGAHQKCIDFLLEIVPQPTLAGDYGAQLFQENQGRINCEYWETISFNSISRTVTSLRINTNCDFLWSSWTKALNIKQDYRLSKKTTSLSLNVQFSGTYLWDRAGRANGRTSVYITAL